MSDPNFMRLLQAKWNEGKFVCVGLDSDMNHKDFPKEIPAHEWAAKHELTPSQRQQLSFNCSIIDATLDIVCAYKPNIAFYPGAEGKRVLQLTIQYINEVAPDVPVILDAKQGDIGNTNDGYIYDDFYYYGADAVTVHNYMGMEAMKPFLDNPDKGVIVLCRTSNPGAGELQDVECSPFVHTATGQVFSTLKEAAREGMEIEDGEFHLTTMPYYLFVAHRVGQKWNYNGNVAVVMGATADEELAAVRTVIRLVPALLPGIGAQGGDLEATVAAGRDSNGQGMIINNSRGVIFAGGGEHSPEKVRAKALEMHEAIQAVPATA